MIASPILERLFNLGPSLGATQTINLSDADYHFISEGGGTKPRLCARTSWGYRWRWTRRFYDWRPRFLLLYCWLESRKGLLFLGASLGNTQEIPVTAADYFSLEKQDPIPLDGEARFQQVEILMVMVSMTSYSEHIDMMMETQMLEKPIWFPAL